MGRLSDWKNKKIGLVLSGGGAKGAYQAGMFRALEELGLNERIQAISGTSIGAMNAMAYALHGVQGVQNIIYGFEQSMSVLRRNAAPEQIMESRKRAAQNEVTMEEFVSKPEFSEFNTDLFLQEMKELMPDATLENYSINVYACAYSLNKKKPEYFYLNSMKPDDQRRVILASASLPFVFQAVKLKSEYYLDGGVIPAVCGANAEPADKIPLKAILQEELDGILVCFLNPADEIERSGVGKNAEYLELRPSRLLEKYPGEGTLDFTRERLESSEQLGYEDTMRLFEVI